jgi:hypothetical protein
VLVPHRPGVRDLAQKEQIIRERHRIAADLPIVFIEAELGDPSEFEQMPLMEIRESEDRFIIGVTRCASVAHVIATVALELSSTGRPPEVHISAGPTKIPWPPASAFFSLAKATSPGWSANSFAKPSPTPLSNPKFSSGKHALPGATPGRNVISRSSADCSQIIVALPAFWVI